MEDFEFVSPTHFVFGHNAESKVGPMLAERGARKVLLHYGGQSAIKSGLIDRVCASLEQAGIEYVKLGGVRPNPEIGLVREGVALCKENGVDWVLAVGGGSAIDTAKGIALGVPYEGDVWDLYTHAAAPVADGKLPVACVLTIPAAGSEASASSVLTNDETLLKKGLSTELNRPVVALMDPELTFTLPAYQTAAGVTDICAHILERFFSTSGPVPVTDELDCGLIRSLLDTAPRAIEDPEDYDARANIMWAGTLAHNDLAGCGRGVNGGRAGGWESHGMEHELSAHDPSIAHGAGLAVIMPAWMRYVWRPNPERFLTLGARVFDIEPVDVVEDCIDATPEEAVEDAVLATIDELQAFFCSLGMPRTLGELGVTADDIPALLETLELNKGAEFGQLQRLTMDDARKIYESAL